MKKKVFCDVISSVCGCVYGDCDWMLMFVFMGRMRWVGRLGCKKGMSGLERGGEEATSLYNI